MMTPLESRILDINSECLGVPVESLMLNAGKELARIVDEHSTGRVLFVCGSGNNGGDGYTASRFLRTAADFTAFRPPKTELCIRMSQGVDRLPYSEDLLKGYDTIVDCVLGTGAEGTIRQPYSDYVHTVNSLGKRVISCDVPSGLGTDTAIHADITVTFHDIKSNMDADTCGTIVVADIGIPAEAHTCVNRGDFLRYKVPDMDSHKGQNGRVVIIGGGPYIGAPACAALGALRVGADLVTILTPRSSFVPIASISPSYIVKGLTSDVLCQDDIDIILGHCKGADAVLIGPGLGLDERTTATVRALVESIDRPMVIDADAITAVAGLSIGREGLIFTPHGRELSRLMGSEDHTDDDIARFCEDGPIVLRKGRVDRIYGKGRYRTNGTGCASMTVGGTGDVLAGIVVGLVSKGIDPFDSACLGAHICGLAGEMAFEEHSYGMTAEDVLAHIGHVLKEGLR